jgi:hypothetical protein
MSIVVTREPDLLSLSKNHIVYKLQSDARIDNPGTAAVNHVKFSGTIADGAVVVLRWKGIEQRMVAKTSPQAAGFEFPAGVVSEAYIISILPYFKDNYYLDADFVVTANTGFGEYWLTFTAREPGSTYNFITQNTPSVQIVKATQGVDRKVKPNFCIYVEAWIEKADGSEFVKIFGESLQVDDSGSTEWNLSDLLHPELSPDIHDWEGRQFNHDINSKRRYYVRYAEAYGEKFQIGKITTGSTKHVTLGGTPYESGATLTIHDVLRESSDITRDRALRLGPDVRYVYPDEPQFLTFLNTRPDPAILVSLKVVAKLATGGTSPVLSIDLGGALLSSQRGTVNVGYAQLNLNEIIGGNAVESYTCQFFRGITPVAISRPYTYVLKYEYKPYRRYFVYLNSLGALDTMHTWGKNSQEIELTRQSAEKYLSVDYKLSDGTFSDWDIQYRQRFEAATGYRHASEIRQLRDFYISRYKYRKYNNKALPISVISNSLKEYEDGASLMAQSFEYAYNFEDDTWSEQEDTPDQYAPPPGFQGAAGAPIVINVPPFPGTGSNGNLLYDPTPIQGSHNLVNSGNLWKVIELLQTKLAKGTLQQYIRGDHTIGNFLTDALQVVNNRLPGFKGEEFPDWIQDETSSGRIAADENIDNTPGGAGGRQSGLYHTPITSKATGWPVDGKKASLIRVVNGTPGSQTGSDLVITSDSKTYVRTVNNQDGNSEWVEIGQNAVHPEFTNIPRLIVTKGEQFNKYIDLAQYKTSYHTLSNLSVEINYNSLKAKGLEIIKDGLLLTFTGKFLEDVSLSDDNILVYVKDQNGNQTTLSCKIGTVEPEEPEEPEEPVDDRPQCPLGPDFFGEPVVNSPSSITFGFHGNGVPDLRIKLYVPGVAVPIRGKDNELISYSNGTATRTITFEALAPGPYDMSIEGSLCKSTPDITRIIIPDTTSGIQWATDYPKYEVTESGSEFKLKIVGLSGSYRTELINMTTGTQEYAQNRDYISDSTIITLAKAGGWQDADYKINVGTLTANIRVGTPTEVPGVQFLLRNSWNGATIADLAKGNFVGNPPSDGYNISLFSNNLGFLWDYAKVTFEADVSGTFQLVPSLTIDMGASSQPLSRIDTWRVFFRTGEDSRFVSFNSKTLNSYGKYRVTYQFKIGGAGGTTVKTYQSVIQLNELKITGGWVKRISGGRVVPVVGGVKYNGVNVVNNNVWTEPWASSGLADRRIEYSFDKVTWYRTSAWFDGEGGSTDQSNLLLLNSASVEPADLFPPGTNKTVYLRDGINKAVVSPPYQINQGAVIGGTLTAKVVATGYPLHMNLVKTKVTGGHTITDTSATTPPSGYNNWYIANREVIVMSGGAALTDYFYDNTKPLMITKIQVKEGVTDLYFWHGNGPDADETLAAAFSENCSMAFETLIFNKK